MSNTTTEKHYVTSVFPTDSGGAEVVYRGCEVDEVDSQGALRIGRQNSSNSGGRSGEHDYVVWAPGTWQRAETTVRDTDPTTVDEAQAGRKLCVP